MSSRSKVPLTFVLRQSDVQPPVFVAGSFSDPPWKLHEMGVGVDQHGHFICTKQIMVNECSDIQYKFRHGSGDWVLDPDAHTVTDEYGNVNSVLHSPARDIIQTMSTLQKSQPARPQGEATGNELDAPSNIKTTVTPASPRDTDANAEEPISPKGAAEKVESKRLFLKPTFERGTSTDTEFTESSFQLDSDEFGFGDDDDDLPMFSHERFAAPEKRAFGVDALQLQRDSTPNSSEGASPLDIDYDDPRLEYFPSDRDSIIDTMRRLSNTVEADQTVVKSVPLSSIISTNPVGGNSPSRKRSPSSNEDDTNMAHKQPTDIARRSVEIVSARNSLDSIAEGDEAPNGDETHDRAGKSKAPVQLVGSSHQRNISSASSASKDDEGITMNISPRGHIGGHSNGDSQ